MVLAQVLVGKHPVVQLHETGAGEGRRRPWWLPGQLADRSRASSAKIEMGADAWRTSHVEAKAAVVFRRAAPATGPGPLACLLPLGKGSKSTCRSCLFQAARTM